MISINAEKREVNISGSFEDIMSEITLVIDNVGTEFAKKGLFEDKYEMLSKITESMRYTDLINAGMDAPEAFRVTTGKDMSTGQRELLKVIDQMRDEHKKEEEGK